MEFQVFQDRVIIRQGGLLRISRLLAEYLETGIFRVILKSFEERDNSKSDIEGTKGYHQKYRVYLFRVIR